MKAPNVLGAGLVAAVLAGCATAPDAHTNAIILPTTPAPTGRATPARVELGAESSEPARLQEAAVPASEEDWRFVISPYGWLLSVDGIATIDGRDSRIDQDFGDILDNLDWVLEGRFEAWKGKWGLMADLTYGELGDDFGIGSLKGDATTDLTLAFLGAQYRFLEQRYADAPRGVTVDGVAGIAYTSIDVELDFDKGPDFDGDENWTDPIIGLRSRVSLSEKWGASLESIIGGFELFDGSDLITMSTVLVGRKVGDSSHFYIGWRTLDIDYEDSDDFALNVNINGPIVGYEWNF